MPTTYAHALAELQQRGIDALKVATDAQLASIETTRDIALTMSAPAPIAAALAPMTGATMAFTFALLQTQLAYAKQLSQTFAGTALPASAPLATATATATEPFAAAAEPLAAAIERNPVAREPAPLETATYDTVVVSSAMDDLRAEQQRDMEVLSKTLPAPSAKASPAAPCASNFGAKPKTVPTVSSDKAPKRGSPKK